MNVIVVQSSKVFMPQLCSCGSLHSTYGLASSILSSEDIVDDWDGSWASMLDPEIMKKAAAASPSWRNRRYRVTIAGITWRGILVEQDKEQDAAKSDLGNLRKAERIGPYLILSE